jgi:glutathione S-transferase
MSLTLYFHPLSSYCQKVLIALYENATAFTPQLVDLGNAEQAAALRRLWPFGRFPVLRDQARARTVAESSIIIEYLQQHHPGATRFIPDDPEHALATRMTDRFYDLYVMDPMQRIVGDRLRPADAKDPLGVEQCRARLAIAYDMIEAEMATRRWAAGDDFTMADCAAAPSLYYANLVQPFGDSRRQLAAYFDRLMARPSFKRAVDEAEPYREFFPKG